MSEISIWYFLIHDEFLENCMKIVMKIIVIKVFKIRLILHYRASRIPELPGPLSGPWTPAARAFALRTRDVGFAHIHYFQPPPPPPLQKSFLRPCIHTHTHTHTHTHILMELAMQFKGTHQEANKKRNISLE